MATNNSLNNKSGGFTVTTFAAAGVVTNNSSGVLATSAGTNGQILIAQTSAAPAWANITSNASTITVTNGANTINLEVANASLAWVNVTSSTQTMAIGTGYITNNASQVVYTLPTTAAQGTIMEIAGGTTGASGWQIAQNASQSIKYGSSTTTTGVSGTLTSTNQYDAIKLLCITANTTWTVLSSVGNLTVV